MTRDETIELIKVMQAFVDGKAVQKYLSTDYWANDNDPDWHPDYKWRIKPEPRALWELRLKNGEHWILCSEKNDAIELAQTHGYTIHEYREVLPGEST